MNSIRDIAAALMSAENVLLYPHVGIDGDAVGSCAAVSRALRKLGKRAYALYKEELPANLAFMDSDENGEKIFSDDPDIIRDEDLDISMCVDCGGYDRISPYKDKFTAAPLTLILDHHATSVIKDSDGNTGGIADISVIEPGASACGILVMELLKEMQRMTETVLIPDTGIGEAIFAAITTDTGNFQYSNTDAASFEAAAEIKSWGTDTAGVSTAVYENVRLEEIRIKSCAMDRLMMISNGRGAVSYVTESELKKIGVLPGETDSIINEMRAIRGVEVAAFLKEKEPDVIRVSYRSKSFADVAHLAAAHNGGGHKKAAGCTLNMPIEEAAELVRGEIADYLGKTEK